MVMSLKNALYIVSIPIGNPDDITLRAIRVLTDVDILVCEEYRNGSRLMKQLGIKDKQIITTNEHNESQQIEALLIELAQGKSLALVSDCGTPLFSDPGHRLVEEVISAGFQIIPVPGVSALTTAISVTPQKLTRYVFGGFMPRAPQDRLNELKKLKMMRLPVILMDTPYRMTNLLEDVKKVFGKGQRVTICCDLTLPSELIITASVEEVLKKVGGKKAEFMLVIM